MANDINFVERKNSLFFKKIKSKTQISNQDQCEGYLIDSDEKETRKILEFLKNSKNKLKIAIKARDEIYNRRVIETMNFDFLISPEINFHKDSLKQRSSGLNHVLLKECTKKNISLVVGLGDLLKYDKNLICIYISRIIQNVELARKSKTNFKIASLSADEFFSEKQRKAISLSWNMSSQQISACCDF